MATIAENLQKIINSKAAIKTSIINKGGSITDSTPLDEYAPAIDNLPSGGGGEWVNKEVEAASLPSGWLSNIGSLIEELTIPSQYTELGTSYGTYGVADMTDPNKKGNIAGLGAPKIKTITATTITALHGPVFNGFSSLETLNGDFSGVISLDDLAFNSCSHLQSMPVNIAGLSSIGKFALMYVTCLPETIVFTNSSLKISEGAFSRTNVVSVDMSALTATDALLSPASNTSYYGIFGNCTSLSSVVLPPNITTLPAGCFSQCKALHEITIPANVTLLDNSSLNTGASLTIHMLPTTPPAIGSMGALPQSSYIQHIYVPAGTVDTYKAAPGWNNNYIKNKIEEEP